MAEGDNIAIGNNPALRNMKDPVRGRGELITEGMTYDEWNQMMKDNGIRWKIYPDRVRKSLLMDGDRITAEFILIHQSLISSRILLLQEMKLIEKVLDMN